MRKNQDGSPSTDLVLIDYGFVTPWDPEDDAPATFQGTDIYASDNVLMQRFIGPADDLESLGYAFMEMILKQIVPW